ncbi:MAG: GNAT family N-acetyltransferase [Bryobacteraceae bacterium]
MPLLTDRAGIRALLNTDRIWSVFALGDLRPEVFAKSLWFTPDLTLVLRDYGTSILFAMGEGSVAEALDHVTWPTHVQVQPRTMELVERLAVVTKRTRMWRMGWSGDRSGWVETAGTRRLRAADVPALLRLYADGERYGESPDFFFPSMVKDGMFFGAFAGDEIVAAAGTHLYAPEEGAAAMGNIYTRRDWRGRGLGKVVTCATLAELAPLGTVGLSVRVDNAPAIRVYESLGFRKHCEFFEGLAVR